jgi:hypothetical protein
MSLGFHASHGEAPPSTAKARGDQPTTEARGDQGGFALVFFALAIVALLGIAALVVDVGYWYLEAAHMQRAADAAALGGVVYLPNSPGEAATVADELAQVNGFDKSLTVKVTAEQVPNNPDQLKVSITDLDIPTFFAKIFGLDAISETRSSVAQYDPPVPLGSPENSLGTGNLTLGSAPAGVSPAPTCGGVNCANYWLGISGFCAAREDGDEFSSFYAGDRADGNTDCPDDTDAPSPNPSASTIFDNPEYRSTGYTYDIDVPSNGSTTDPATPEDVTVEIYDPAYNPVRETGGSLGSCTVASPGSIPGDSATGWGTDGTCAGYTNSEVNTDWILEAPSNGSSGAGTVIDPPDASTSDPGVFLSGDTTCENSWCSLGTIPSGSTPGNYQLHLWTQADEPNSYGSNQFALRAVVGDGPGVGNACGANGSLSSCTGAVDTTTFTPCSATAEYGLTADPQCPEVHGDDAMSIYVNSAGTATCNPGPRQEQPPPANPVTTDEPCSTFYLAQVSPDYAGKKMDILLFDPGEGATAIRVLQPDATPGIETDDIPGVSPASFTYETCDDATGGCPGLSPGLDGPSPVPASDFYSSDGLDPPKGTTTCICDPGLKPGPLPGRASPSQYNDRYLLIQTTVPSAADLAANGGWYMVEYTFGGGSVTDRTTWGVSLLGSPVHLVL